MLNSNLPIYVGIITGLFTLSGVILTWVLTNYREKQKYRRDAQLSEYKELELFYISILSYFEKNIKYIKTGRDEFDLISETTILMAKVSIKASQNIKDKVDDLCLALFEWSSAYEINTPMKIDDTKAGLISSQSLAHSKIVVEWNFVVIDKFQDLIKLIRGELLQSKQKIKTV